MKWGDLTPLWQGSHGSVENLSQNKYTFVSIQIHVYKHTHVYACYRCVVIYGFSTPKWAQFPTSSISDINGCHCIDVCGSGPSPGHQVWTVCSGFLHPHSSSAPRERKQKPCHIPSSWASGGKCHGTRSSSKQENENRKLLESGIWVS